MMALTRFTQRRKEYLSRKGAEEKRRVSLCYFAPWCLCCFAPLRETLLLTLFISVCSSLIAQNSHYTIDATLNTRSRTVDAQWKLNYTNNSSDTLKYIWLQLWPNAFKNDRTAYSEALLDSGRNDFYFSATEQKGYINRLVFKTGGEVLQQEDHPQYIDIIKVYLLHPLLPGRSVEISTPFHLKLPYNFSGFGYSGRSFQLQNWYPSAAPLNKNEWDPKPFTGAPPEAIADFDVRLTLPARYAVTTNAMLADSAISDTLKTLSFVAKEVNDLQLYAEIPGIPHLGKPNAALKVDSIISKLLSKTILPAIGYNVYDGFQIGLLLHGKAKDGETPVFIAPMYGTSGKDLTGYAGVNLNIRPGNYFRKVTVGVNGALFSDRKGTDSLGRGITGRFGKVVPFARVFFPDKNRHNEDWLEFKTFIIAERNFDYVQYSADSFYYPAKGSTATRYLNQLTFNHTSRRSLYPYDAQLQLQQASDFYRVNAEAHYFFNYASGGGLQARVFAAKFGYLGNADYSDTYRYQPKLTAVRGDEDYTYGNAFAGRNEFTGFASQQIMMRDGGLKIRTDLFQDLQGRSDNWVASMNLNTTLPAKIFPAGFPLKLFLDVGTYAGAWQKNSALPRFLYVSGLQLSLLKNAVNIYAPVLYSSEFRNSLKTVPEENGFFKKISFSVDFGNFLSMFNHK